MSSKKKLYIDMDDVLCDFQSAYSFHKNKHSSIDYPQSIPGFFEALDPIDGAIDAVNTLRNSHLYDVYVLTAPSTKNIHS